MNQTGSPTRTVLALVILLACCAPAFALDPTLDISQYAHTAWKIRDGFTKGMITSIAQTPDGYLWLGTDLGLYRFDGVRAVPWQPPAGEQLPSSFIFPLLVGRDGTLWIGTLKGLASWKNGKLTQHSEVAGSYTVSLLEDRKGTVWVGTVQPGKESSKGRLCAIEGGKTECYGAGSFGIGVTALYEDHESNLWVAAGTGLWRWTPGPAQHYSFPPGESEVSSMIEDEKGNLLLAANEGLKELVDGKIQSYALPGFAGHFRPHRLFRSGDGSLWIGTEQGLIHLHQERVDGFKAVDGLSGDSVEGIFEDREGSIWVSADDGLDRFRQYAVPTVSTNEGLSNAAAWCVQATADGSVWVCTADGLNRWNSRRVTIYGNRSAPHEGRAGDDRDVGTDRVTKEIANSGLAGTPRSLGLDDRGRLWVSSTEGVFYLEAGRLARVPGIPGGLMSSMIAGDGRGNVWLVDGGKGLFHWTPKGPKGPQGTVQQVPLTQFGEGSARALGPDRTQGGAWLGFFQGGMAYFQEGQVRASYSAADGLGAGRVNDIRFETGEALWVATESGLSRIKEGHIATLTSKNGLPCNEVHWSIEDDDHNVWLYQPCGLVRIARSELDAWVADSKRVLKTTVFDTSDGVRSVGVYGGYGPHVTKSPDGRIWFVSRSGVSVIDPHNLPFNKLPPTVHIEQIIADRKTYDSTSDAGSRLSLPPLVRDLEIDYTALSLVAPEKVRFRVKLEGYDRDWQEVGNRRQAFYGNLAPRNYRLRVMACNNSGVWNREGAFLDFLIPPVWYQTNWSRTVFAVMFLAMLWAAYRLRVRVLQQRQAVLERHQGEIRALNEQLFKAQEAERVRIAGELHDGVLQQITSLSLVLGTIRREVPQDSEAKTKIREVQQKLMQVGTDVRQLSHELHPAVLQEAGLPAALSAYCQEFSKARGISVSYEADESVNDLSAGAALCLYRIAQEALGNAAKYAAAKQVEVRLSRANGRVRLSVSDDGVGCNPQRIGESRGLGLINMRERVLQLSGTFEFDSAPGRGTTVRAEVPFRPA